MGGLDVAARLSREVDNYRARLHRVDHGLGDQDGRLHAGDECRRDDDVDLAKREHVNDVHLTLLFWKRVTFKNWMQGSTLHSMIFTSNMKALVW